MHNCISPSAEEGYRGSNCYILASVCGPSTVEGERYGPYRLHDMMMMIMMRMMMMIMRIIGDASLVISDCNQAFVTI